MLKILLADDEPGVLALLEGIISEVPGFVIVGKTQNIKDTLKCFAEHAPDIVLLDIQFPDGSGLNLAKQLVVMNSDIDIVFVTGYAGFALEAFEIYSFDYILKPIDECRVLRTLNKIKQEREAMLEKPLHKPGFVKMSPRLGIKVGEEIVLLNPAEILFIESTDKKVRIHTYTHTYDTTDTLLALETKLQGPFYRSHKAYIVNLNLIEKIVAWTHNAYMISFKKSDKQAFLSRRKANALLKHFL